MRSKNIKDRSVGLRDISRSTRSSLRGQQGPAGATGPAGPAGPGAATYGVVAESTGQYVRSKATASDGAAHTGGTGVYEVLFNVDVSNCLAAATVAGVDGVVQPENGEIVATIAGRSVFVRTRTSSGGPTDLPFHLIVSC